MACPSIGPSVAEILESHAGGSGSPVKTAARVADAIAARGDDGTWLSTVPRDELLAAAGEIENRAGARMLPLYGVPFGVKDSIDVEGVPTTLSCPDYAYVATSTAPVIQRLLDAGALYVVRRTSTDSPPGSTAPGRPIPCRGVSSGASFIWRLEFRLGVGGRAGPGAVRGGD